MMKRRSSGSLFLFVLLFLVACSSPVEEQLSEDQAELQLPQRFSPPGHQLKKIPRQHGSRRQRQPRWQRESQAKHRPQPACRPPWIRWNSTPPQRKILGRSAQCGWRMKTPFLAGHFLHIFLVYHSVMIVSGWSTKMVSLKWLWGSLRSGSSHLTAPVSYLWGRITAATFSITT